MSQKRILNAYPVLTAQSMASSFASLVTNIQYLDNLSFEISWTGTPVGTFTVQGSNSYAMDTQTGTVQNAGVWTDLVLSTIIAPAGSAGQALINLQELAFSYIRLYYTAASGAGTCSAIIAGKSFA